MSAGTESCSCIWPILSVFITLLHVLIIYVSMNSVRDFSVSICHAAALLKYHCDTDYSYKKNMLK